MKHIIFDCDNTFGVPNCDVDDGLALIYLLGCRDVTLHGVTTTYGNSQVDIVYQTTKQMLKELGRQDIELKKGGSCAGDYHSDASEYLVRMARKYAGQLSILATGSLTNLLGAYKQDASFFENVKEIVLMGGITRPLLFDKRQMNELNFSCDANATYTVLTKGKNVSIITGNNCLKVLFTRQEYKEKLFRSDGWIEGYIRKKTDYWFGYNEECYGIEGFYNWDVVAAVYLITPDLFTERKVNLYLSEEDLKRGYLRVEKDAAIVPTMINLPEIGEEDFFKENIYYTWHQVEAPPMNQEGEDNK